MLCAGQGEFVLDGSPRMRERPIVDLVEGLTQVSIRYVMGLREAVPLSC